MSRSMSHSSSKSAFMERAFALAARAGNRVYPNPKVGAVLVRKDRIVGEGYHSVAGEAHAEVVAIRDAGKKARGSDLYVTLEPCSTTGKTPPCTESIIDAGIQRVFFGSLDPDTKNRGRATRMLRQRGVEVTCLKWEQQDKDLNKVFHHACSSRTPYVILKVAMSLDGYITDSKGHSRWVTGTKARMKGHELRRQCNGILIGGGTCNKDNPRLQIRLPGPRDWVDPQRIILSGGLNLNPKCPLFTQPQKQPPWVITTPDVVGKTDSFAKARMIPLSGVQGKIPVKKVLRSLRQKGITALLVEGGAEIMSLFLKERCFHEFHLFMAPRVFGGSALSWSGLPVLDGVARHSWLTLAGMEQLGEDCHLIYRCNKAA